MENFALDVSILHQLNDRTVTAACLVLCSGGKKKPSATEGFRFSNLGNIKLTLPKLQ